MKKSLFFFVLAITTCLAFTNAANAQLDGCPAPANLTVTAQDDGSVSFDWDDCGCSSPVYRVYYENNGFSGPVYSTGSSSITVSGLSAGTYRFYFYTVCGEGMSSIIIEDIII
ncbi:MAG: fibronectin type III domain-containing protein [Lewinellaceae bacterium]|nr:fibronectin type III domain-containing protein [Saprospiraceae bacterium]MCB9340057.1 fibronectin type III domain-containing protein [Lewinellaceae bacterium]